MTAVFADTLYWIAIVRPGDPWRDASERARQQLGEVELVTTDDVLAEFLTAMSGGGVEIRRRAASTVRQILACEYARVVPQSRDGFLAALNVYTLGEDKGYSFTDCRSMQIMRSEGIQKVLTNDHHFAKKVSRF